MARVALTLPSVPWLGSLEYLLLARFTHTHGHTHLVFPWLAHFNAASLGVCREPFGCACCVFVLCQGADRFAGQDHGAGLPRLAALAAELQQPAAVLSSGGGAAQALASLSVASLRLGQASAGGRPARPAAALKLGAVGGGQDTGEGAVWAAALQAEVAGVPSLRWVDELRRGVALVYDPNTDQFVRVRAQTAPPASSSAATGSTRAEGARAGAALAACADTLRRVAARSGGFATRKTVASLGKLSALAAAAEDAAPPDGANTATYPPGSSFQAAPQAAVAAADYELALLQVLH